MHRDLKLANIYLHY